VCNGLEYIWTHGGNVLDPEDPSKVVIDSPESVAGLATEHSMIADGVSPEAVPQYKEEQGGRVARRVPQGRCGLLLAQLAVQIVEEGQKVS
jgi:hypothetical protein